VKDEEKSSLKHPQKLTKLYRKFYRANKRYNPKANAVLKPIDIAANTILNAESSILQGEALVAAVAAEVFKLMDRVHASTAEGRWLMSKREEERQAVLDFAHYFVVDVFDKSFAGDRARLAGLQLNLIRDTCAFLYGLEDDKEERTKDDQFTGDSLGLHTDSEQWFTRHEEGSKPNHVKALTELYRKFYRANKRYNPKSNAVLKPIDIAADTILKAESSVFQGETLVAAVAAEVFKLMDRVHASTAEGRWVMSKREEERQAVLEFARYFVEDVFEKSFASDRARLAGRQLNLIRDTCEFLYRLEDDKENISGARKAEEQE
jgi:hypothetical protein